MFFMRQILNDEQIVGFHIWRSKGFDKSLNNKYFPQREEEKSDKKLEKKYRKETLKYIEMRKKFQDKKRKG